MAAVALIALGTAVATGAGWIARGFWQTRRGNTRTQPHYVDQPHPGWKPGQSQPPPFSSAEVVSLDPDTTDKGALYPFVISAVTPRPIAFVCSMSQSGCINLSPYSYFNVLSHNPPIVAIGACRSPSRCGGKKDTLANIEETGEFVVNIISDWYVEAANHTCGEYDPDIDEMALTGLTPLPSVKVKPPRVKEAAVQMECKTYQIIELQDKSGTPTCSIILGQVVLFHVLKDATGHSPSGKLVVDPLKVQAMSRHGGFIYGRTTEFFEIARPNKDGSYPNFEPTFMQLNKKH